MTNISDLYNFRVNDGRSEKKHETRRKAAKQVASLLKKGYKHGEIDVEQRVNGVWQYDPKIRELADKYVADSNGKTAAERPKVTIQKMLRELAQVAKLAAQEDTLSDEHMVALEDRMTALMDQFESHRSAAEADEATEAEEEVEA